ncbi:hypothetical protein ABSA28_00910 [Candidatus Hepatincolaceae symbiont of Richtersius coronifer]
MKKIIIIIPDDSVEGGLTRLKLEQVRVDLYQLDSEEYVEEDFKNYNPHEASFYSEEDEHHQNWFSMNPVRNGRL